MENELRQSKQDSEKHIKIMQSMSETHNGNTGKWCDVLRQKVKFAVKSRFSSRIHLHA